MRPVLPLVAVLLTVAPSLAQWGPPPCPPVGGPIVILPQPLPEPEPIFNLPVPRRAKPIFGVETDKIHGVSHSINGRPCSRQEALQAIQAGIPDDTKLIRVTVIGPDADRKPVVADLASHPALAEFKSQIVVQDYAPTDWAVSQGFVTSGHPTIYVQQPDGKVLHRQDDYSGGPEKLAQALRKARPDYKPDADPNLNAPLPVSLSKIPVWVWAAGGIALLLLLRGKQ